MAVQQKVAEAKADAMKDVTLEDKINEKIQGHAENGWFLREIYINDVDSALLFFELRADATQS